MSLMASASVPYPLLVSASIPSSVPSFVTINFITTLYIPFLAPLSDATSALRFFYLEDLMIEYNFREIIHIEADNMLYGKMTNMLDILRKDYVGIAATPLTARKTFITASVFWVANLRSLRHFNDYLYGLGSNTTGQWSEYAFFHRPSF